MTELTIAGAVLITVVLIIAMFYTTKKGYSRNWEDD